MITNFSKFNESLRDKLVGPTEDEVMDNFKDLSPNKLLSKSCKKGFLKGVQVALEQGADIHTYNTNPLIDACNNDNFDIIKLLIENGADISNMNRTLLSTCINANNYEMVKFLLENGARPFGIPTPNTTSYDNSKIVELLKKYM